MVPYTTLIYKLSVARSLRYTRDQGWIDHCPPLSNDIDEMERTVSSLVQRFVHAFFEGYETKVDEDNIYVCIRGPIVDRELKVYEVFENSQWRYAFERYYPSIYRTYMHNRNPFSVVSDYIDATYRSGCLFLTIPHSMFHIRHFCEYGVYPMFYGIKRGWENLNTISNLYELIVEKMEELIPKMEQERKENMKYELIEEKNRIARRLLRPIEELKRSENPVDRLFARKMEGWCWENRKRPYYALPPTYENIIQPGETHVRVFAPPGSNHEGWIALPHRLDNEPEGYEFKGVATVKRFDVQSPLSLNGRQPIVAGPYLGFDLKYWLPMLPDGYLTLYETSRRLREEARQEISTYSEEQIAALFPEKQSDPVSHLTDLFRNALIERGILERRN